MRMSEAFPSKWLKAADFKGRGVIATIDDVEMEKVGDDSKPIVYFRGKEKGLCLNKTNASVIVEDYGDDTRLWKGKPIEMFPDKTSFQGKMVACIRVRVPETPEDEAPPEADELPPGTDDEPPPPDDSEIPF